MSVDPGLCIEEQKIGKVQNMHSV